MSAEFDDGGERDEFGLEPPEDGEPAPQADTCLYVYVHNNTACGLSLKAHAEGMTVSHDFVAKRDKRDRDPRDVMADMGWIAKKPVEPAPQTKGACTCKNVPLTASSGGISAPQPECPEHWPDPDAAVRATLDVAIDWAKYPKLRALFEHRPRANVYWLELAALANDLARARRGRKSP